VDAYPGILCPSRPRQQPRHYLPIRIANGWDSLDDLVRKGISLFFRLSSVLARLIARLAAIYPEDRNTFNNPSSWPLCAMLTP
jgi:hypothetical protein